MTHAAKRLARSLSVVAVILLFFLLLLEPQAAMDGAARGLTLCAATIIPSLFPFFVASSLLSAMGLPQLLGRLCAPLMSRLFSVSGSGAAAFVLGLSGGYPLGAATVADMVKSGSVSRREGGRLLCFCNNSGPAFIVGAAGVGVFGSGLVGLVLYLIHILAAVLCGMLTSSGERREGGSEIRVGPVSFTAALPACVRSAASSLLSICGFVVFFSVIVRILDAVGIFMSLAGGLSAKTGFPLSACRAFLTGILELGSGIGAMSGSAAKPASLALCAFILGWGGLSVHCQTLSVIENSGISAPFYLPAKLIHGLISAILALGIFTLLVSFNIM